jgi:rfaE bifunctional protein kinase chain/domain
MTGPNKPDDKAENSKPPEKTEGQNLSLSDLMNRDRAQQAAKAPPEINKDREVPVYKPDTSNMPRPGYTYNFGQSPSFQIRKSEFKHELEKPETEVRPLVEKFLKDTPQVEHQGLTPAELHELTQTRDSLSRFTTSSDALSKALHLARLYQHVRYIDEAKKATNLSLGIDPENHVGREMFKELERMHPPDIGVTNRTSFAPTTNALLTKSNLRQKIRNLSGGRIIVVGDLLIDELLEGKPERISREAPVLILEHVDTELIPGGAANTANNIAALGGRCHAIGVCGRDEYAAKLAALFDSAGISHDLVQDATRPTTVKTRILSKSHSFKQQLLRLDRICHDEVSPLVEGLLIDRVNKAASGYKAIVINACKSAAQAHNLLVIVDAQDRPERFQNVTLMTPNQPDTEKMVGFALDTKENLEKAGKELLVLTGAKALLVTRGAHGMVLFQQDGPIVELPVFNMSEVFDVTGAGDTVVATMALALVSGSNFVEAMALGNLAAGIVVKKPGTAVTSQQELLENLDLLHLPD